MRALDAWIGARRVGRFTELPQPDGSTLFVFEYDEPAEDQIVSLTMVPVEGESRFESRTFPPPFDMVLPEGERRERIEQARKILRTDSFSLLSYVGANPVNRVKFLPPGEEPTEDPPELPTPAEIAGTKRGRELFRDLVEELDLRQGIAGVQPKALGRPRQSKLSPALRQYRGSTHILKTSTPRFPFLAANEYTCLGIFAAAGIPIPSATLSADGELLLVARFDVDAKGHVAGFEEAAALMGETSATKYQRDYGTMLEVLSDFIAPDAQAAARNTLTKCVILNHLLGNGDAHLKNFGVLYEDASQVSLAPIYDCVSTLPYIPGDVPALTLSFEWYSKNWWPRIKIEEFAAKYGALSNQQIRRMIDELCEAVLGGVTAIRTRGKETSGFENLAQGIATLWTARVDTFRSEESSLRRPMGSRR